MRFHDLDLPPQIMHGIYDLGFQYCTPIQAAILPKVLEGADAAGRAQTGTGKTAVFLIDILTRLLRDPTPAGRRPRSPRALVVAPTRELALQIEKDGKDLSKYMPCKIVAVYGGMDYDKQRRLLSDGLVDIVAATPGRLLDFKRQGDLHLDKVEILIIDEADRMLDMGFIPDVQQIIAATPPKRNRQTMLFSATLTPAVTRFASQWTRDPVLVEVEPEHVAVDTIDQVVYITTMEEKFPLLYNLVTREKLERVIVFGNRRDQTRQLMERFTQYGISSALLSGDVDQKKRIKTLEDFREGRIRVLVATDVAARGLHIDGVSHVVNYNLPMNPEDYVHRIGRTGRAGASGISISFASEDDSFQIPGIEKFIGRELHCLHPEEEWLVLPPPPAGSRRPPKRTEAPSRRPRRDGAPAFKPRNSRGRRSSS
jgi:ATP-dependent RNA helicase RhlB